MRTAKSAMIILTLASLSALGTGFACQNAQSKEPDAPGKNSNELEKPPPPREVGNEVNKVNQSNKLVTLEFEDARWEEVFRWFTKETGLGFASTDKPPTGTFSFKPPRGADGKVKQYTIKEVIDVLNDALVKKGYVLMRREGSFLMVPADERPDSVPLVKLSDLSDRASREWVKVVFGPYKSLTAEELVIEIKPILGRYSWAMPLPRSNTVMLFGQVEALNAAIAHIEMFGCANCSGDIQIYVRILKNIRAEVAREKLIEVFGKPQKDTNEAPPSPVIGDGGRRMDPPPAAPVANKRPHTFTADEKLNAILISGPAEIVAKAKEILDEIDKKPLSAVRSGNELEKVPMPREVPKKLVDFEFHDARWDEVIRWFCKESGLGFGGDRAPSGKFNFQPARGADGKARQYAIKEVIDILNDALVIKGFLWTRRENSFHIIPAEDRPDPSTVPLVKPEELSDWGNREFLKVIIGPLKSVSKEDLVVEIKPILRKYSWAVAMPQSNSIMLVDQAASIKAALKHIWQIENPKEPMGSVYTRVLKCIRAGQAREKLMAVLGDPKRLYSLSADERLNAIMISGPPAIVAKAKKVLDEIDVGTLYQPIVDLSFMKFAVKPGSADAHAKALAEAQKAGSAVRIIAVGDEIWVYGTTLDHVEIGKELAILIKKQRELDLARFGRELAAKNLREAKLESEDEMHRARALSSLDVSELKTRIASFQAERTKLDVQKVKLNSVLQTVQKGLADGTDKVVLLALLDQTGALRTEKLASVEACVAVLLQQLKVIDLQRQLFQETLDGDRATVIKLDDPMSRIKALDEKCKRFRQQLDRWEDRLQELELEHARLKP